MFIVTSISGWLTFCVIIALVILVVMLCTGAFGKIKREWDKAD